MQYKTIYEILEGDKEWNKEKVSTG
jgi:hypothetical protein